MNRHLYFKQQEENELAHHGIKGQKWGIRRYQNPDGSLTAAGKARYNPNKDSARFAKTAARYANSYADYLNSRKTTYFLDDDGNIARRSDGSQRAVTTHDTIKYAEWKKQTTKYLKEKAILQKKYSEVVSKIDLEKDGRSFLSITLKDKFGNTFVSELETKYENIDYDRSDYKYLYSNK
jgi:hypothetical protein